MVVTGTSPLQIDGDSDAGSRLPMQSGKEWSVCGHTAELRRRSGKESRLCCEVEPVNGRTHPEAVKREVVDRRQPRTQPLRQVAAIGRHNGR